MKNGNALITKEKKNTELFKLVNTNQFKTDFVNSI